MVIHHVPGVPVKRDIIKYDKLVTKTTIRDGLSGKEKRP